jgi:hypothetical protein
MTRCVAPIDVILKSEKIIFIIDNAREYDLSKWGAQKMFDKPFTGDLLDTNLIGEGSDVIKKLILGSNLTLGKVGNRQ